MRRLTVKNFSVIDEAVLDIAGINVIIGPQSSGKSLLCRFAYFCLNIVSSAVVSASDELPFDQFKQEIKNTFLHEWFPVKTWGHKKFEIRYEDGPFFVSIVRTSREDHACDNIKLTLCSEFRSTYESALKSIRDIREQSMKKKVGIEGAKPWEARAIASKRFAEVLGAGRIFEQLYIPAGRALFTNYSKAIRAFRVGSLDPITAEFGQMAEWLFSDRVYIRDRDRNHVKAFDEIQDTILKGRLSSKKDTVQFETSDGRTLSLEQLSSGEQEALPLLRSLRLALSGPDGLTVFAEEPEAHLFPSSQYEIVKLLCWLSNARAQRVCIVVTTHSPYILSAFNNLIFAGQLGQDKLLKKKIKIDERFWIEPGFFKAYSIHDGKSEPILSETGLINGEYLDGVSDKIGSEFDELMRLEYEQKKAS
jgi:ABC-type polar amino acid transport system ATPase subunit